MTSPYYNSFGCWRCWRWPGQDTIHATFRRTVSGLADAAEGLASSVAVACATFDDFGRALVRFDRRLRRERVWRARIYLLRKRARRFLP